MSMSKLRLAAALISILAAALPACGGCGDDTAVMPDAEDVIDDPDAELPAPDAEPPVDPRPGPVTNLTATPDDPAEVDLAWTNPTDADLAGVLVVVSATAITFDPTDGTTYTAAQDLGGGQTVLAVGDAAAATLAAATVGVRYHFAAWAFDDATQYSVEATVSGVNNTLGAQTATLSVSLAGVVTVTAQPADLTLSGTAVYTAGTSTLDIDLAVQNDTGRLLFNLKGLTTAQNEGAQAGNTFPLTGGQPSTYFGPEALDVGATANRTLNLTGITGGTDPVTVTLSFVDAPMLYNGRYDELVTVDTSGSGETSAARELDATKHGALSPDGRFLYVGQKNLPAIVTLDTTTLTAVVGSTLGDAANTMGGIGGLALSHDAIKLYAVVNDGLHYNGGIGDGSGNGAPESEIQLVELNRSDLSEVQRLTLRTADTTLRTAKQLVLNATGTRAAIVVSTNQGTTAANELWLVDLATFTVIDADAATDGAQPVALSGQGYAYKAAWLGTSVYAGFNNRNWLNNNDDPIGLDVVDTTTFVVTAVAAPAGSGNTASQLVAHGGKVYYTSIFDDNDATDGTPLQTEGLHVFDGANVTAPSAVVQARGIAFHPSGAWYYLITNGNGAFVHETATDLAVDLDGDTNNGVTALPMANDGSGLTLVTPF